MSAKSEARRRLTNPGVQYVPTTGTILVLSVANVIQNTEKYYTPASLGSFNLHLQVTVECNHNLGLLTKQAVLDTLRQQPYNNNEVRRMVGGGFPGQHPLRTGLEPEQAAVGHRRMRARAPPPPPNTLRWAQTC